MKLVVVLTLICLTSFGTLCEEIVPFEASKMISDKGKEEVADSKTQVVANRQHSPRLRTVQVATGRRSRASWLDRL